MLNAINKQLLDEVEHDIMNYQNRGVLSISAADIAFIMSSSQAIVN